MLPVSTGICIYVHLNMDIFNTFCVYVWAEWIPCIIVARKTETSIFSPLHSHLYDANLSSTSVRLFRRQSRLAGDQWLIKLNRGRQINREKNMCAGAFRAILLIVDAWFDDTNVCNRIFYNVSIMKKPKLLLVIMLDNYNLDNNGGMHFVIWYKVV